MALGYDARHMSNNRQYEVQRNNHFEVIIPDMGDDFTLLVSRCNFPEIGVDVVELNYGNTKAKVAGIVNLGEGSLDIRDSIILDTEKKIHAWHKLVYDPDTGKMGWIDEYKKDCLVNQYGPDGTYVRSWILEGCWPSNVTYGEGDYSNADAKTITMTLQYDNARLQR